jgi:DNA-directed RNA polymerase subunit beta
LKNQFDSFQWFQEEGLKEILEEFHISDVTGKRFELRFLNYEVRPPVYSEEECQEKDLTYSAALYVKAQLLTKETGEFKEQWNVFLANFPLMTSKGTFIINGAGKVMVSQLLRSPGVYFTSAKDLYSGQELGYAKLIPNHGVWTEFSITNKDVILVKFNNKRKFLVTTLLKALGYNDKELLSLFSDVDGLSEHRYIETSLKRGLAERTETEALIEIYQDLRPGDIPTLESARNLVNNLFFNSRHFDLGKVGRYKLNQRLGKDLLLINHILTPSEISQLSPKEIEAIADQHFTQRTPTREDLVAIVRHLIMVNNGLEPADNIDDLSNRRLCTVGELIQKRFRLGMLNLERPTREHMNLVDAQSATPGGLLNPQIITASLRDFFNTSPLCQFMDQTNLLAELTHERRISVLGPGGLAREQAGLEVRDIHHSFYGRICPIETPEGPNIGLINSPAIYSQINEYGFLTTPYRRVKQEVQNEFEELLNRTLRETIVTHEGKVQAKEGTKITEEIALALNQLNLTKVKVFPFASEEIVYLDAEEERNYIIAQANVRLDSKGQFVDNIVEVRQGRHFLKEEATAVDFIDVSPKQIVGVSASLIPFLEHDDANRALMGSNMERQAVALLCPEAPIVGTGMESKAALSSGQLLLAKAKGKVVSVGSGKIEIENESGVKVYPLIKFRRTNQGTCFSQRPRVSKGDWVEERDILADSSMTQDGELALGQNVLCAFMSWEGYNYEDAIIISERLLKQDKFTSIRIERYETTAREEKVGQEEITRDIPNLGGESLRYLDERGIVQTGARVNSGDILVGKVAPKGEVEPNAEERLLRAIFGAKARGVEDVSLRMPHGERGIVIRSQVFSHQNHRELPEGVEQTVIVWIAQKRKISEGDKLSGRHGNKGVASIILPEEDMPFLPDGTPVDIILNPIGVPSRMNLGQILETHLGWAAKILGFKAVTPVFEGASSQEIEDELARAWMVQQANASDSNLTYQEKVNRTEKWLLEQGLAAEGVFEQNQSGLAKSVCLRIFLEKLGVATAEFSNEEVTAKVEEIAKEGRISPPIYGKTIIYDGRTGEPFDQPITVGYIYMMKLTHLVEDKVHARSTGPYSLITQQPLGGRAQFGGQRFGEMEVWALEAYGAAYTLQEMLTIKSDDISGRAKAYEAIIKGEDISPVGLPESFKVLIKELQSLGISVQLLKEEEIEN